jgi:hypothetical protein
MCRVVFPLEYLSQEVVSLGWESRKEGRSEEVCALAGLRG